MPATIQRFLHQEGGYHPSLTAAPKMNYIELINHFWQLDAEQVFGASATRLYFFLVQTCNRKEWVNPFTLSDAHLCMSLDMTANTMKKARQELVERGLLRFNGGNSGRGLATVYTLAQPGKTPAIKVSKNNTYGTEKVAVKVSDKLSENDTYTTEKVSAKVSKNDTLYKEKTKTSSVVENKNQEGESAATAAAPAPVVEEVSEAVQAQFDKWHRWAQKNAPRVLKMKVPVTPAELDRLVKKYGGALVLEIFSEMDNWEPLTTKRRYAAKTCATWCANRKTNPLPKGANGTPAAPTRISGNYAASTHPQKIR